MPFDLLPLGHPRLLEAQEDLESGDLERTSRSKPDWTALHWFGVESQPDGTEAQARVLLGQNPSAQNDEGDTPMHLATWAQHQDRVAFLLELGADANLPNRKNHLSIHLALRKKNSALFALLLPVTSMTPDLQVDLLKLWAEKGWATSPDAVVWSWAKAVPKAQWDAAGVVDKLPQNRQKELRSFWLDQRLPSATSSRSKPRF